MTVVAFVPAHAAVQPRHRRGVSKEVVIAIGVSLAVHVGVIGYIATQKLAEMRLPHGDPPAVGVETFRLPHETQPRPQTVKTLTFHDPKRVDTPPLIDPVQTVITPPVTATVDPPVAIATTLQPQQPPIQLADLRPVEPDKARMIANPSWLRRPTGEELGRLYPRLALERNISGGATLLCEVAANGAVRACSVIDEAPKGRGFGDAALAGAKLFKLNPRTVDGQAVEGAKVRIPLVFNLAD